MKKFRILCLCLALSLSVCLFAGCTDRDTPQQSEDNKNTESVAQIHQDDELEPLEGQDQEIEIDEGDAEDPFGA